MSLTAVSQRVGSRIAGSRGLQTLVESFRSYLDSNVVASGGLTVLCAGGAVALARSCASYTSELVRRRYVARAEFDSRDDSYRWMVCWLATQRPLGSSRAFTVTTTLRRLGASGPEEVSDEGIYFIPSGSCVLRHGGKWMLVEREQKDDEKSSKERESLRLQVLCGTEADLRAVVDDAKRHYEETRRQRTSVYALEDYGAWTLVVSRAARPLTSVILNDPAAVDALRDDCARFLASEDTYARRGIPYRRGYLLHGSPGTGKTSLVLAVAAELEKHHGLKGLYVVSPALDDLNDNTFAEALRNAKSPSILLIEDIDAAFSSDRQGKTANGLTFSGLLNAIDGALAQEGRLLFLTTNHPERLDPALVRPGRIDYTLDFPLCSKDAVLRYAKHFYFEAPRAATDAIADAAPDSQLSVAALQALFSRHPEDPRKAAEELASTGLDRAA